MSQRHGLGRRLAGWQAVALAAVALAAVALVLAASLLAAGRAEEPAAAQGAELRVFAAASLADAFDELGPVFESQNTGARVTFNYGPSSGLRVQIEQGAPADVLATADQAQMDRAQRNGIVAGASQTFARNELVLIVPRDNPARIEALQDLAQPGLRLVTTNEQVPIGAYTRQMLAAMSADEAFGADFAQRVLANVRSEEDNVRAVVAKVVLGEADGGVVYTSDVTPRVAPEVRQLPIPPPFTVVATYPIAVVQGARQPALAERWVDLVLSETGQRALARWGFQPVR